VSAWHAGDAWKQHARKKVEMKKCMLTMEKIKQASFPPPHPAPQSEHPPSCFASSAVSCSDLIAERCAMVDPRDVAEQDVKPRLIQLRMAAMRASMDQAAATA
jgi:hypothetical protein